MGDAPPQSIRVGAALGGLASAGAGSVALEGGGDERATKRVMPGALTAPALAGVTLVAVGSRNPVKLAAARAVLGPLLTPQARFEAAVVTSGVRDQPWGDEETIRGARSRAESARAALDADLGVGLEGGVVEERGGAVRTCAWAAVVDRAGRVGTGGSLAMPLPRAVAAALRRGVELGHAIDALVRATNTKHGAGAVGVLTAGLIDRQRAYEVLVTYALTPWLVRELWDESTE